MPGLLESPTSVTDRAAAFASSIVVMRKPCASGLNVGDWLDAIEPVSSTTASMPSDLTAPERVMKFSLDHSAICARQYSVRTARAADSRLRQVDEDDIRVVLEPIEGDVRAVRRDVKRARRAGIH